MNWLLPSLPPTYEAALRDVEARRPEARVHAAERLGLVQPEQAARARTALLRLLDDAAPEVRAAAVHALGEHGADAPARALAARVDDADGRVRELAVIALARAGDDVEARHALRRALGIEHAEVRFQAVHSYTERFPDEAAAEVAPLLDDDDAEVRANAARALGECPHADAAALTRALADTSRNVRHEAAVALARMGAPVPTGALMDALGNPDTVVDALDALGNPAHQDAADRIAAMGDALLRPLPVKAAAGRALARMGDPRGIVVLRRVLGAWRTDARNAAVAIIGELALAELAADVARLAEHPRGVDRETLRGTLQALAPHSDVARAALACLGDAPGT